MEPKRDPRSALDLDMPTFTTLNTDRAMELKPKLFAIKTGKPWLPGSVTCHARHENELKEVLLRLCEEELVETCLPPSHDPPNLVKFSLFFTMDNPNYKGFTEKLVGLLESEGWTQKKR